MSYFNGYYFIRLLILTCITLPLASMQEPPPPEPARALEAVLSPSHLFTKLFDKVYREREKHDGWTLTRAQRWLCENMHVNKFIVQGKIITVPMSPLHLAACEPDTRLLQFFLQYLTEQLQKEQLLPFQRLARLSSQHADFQESPLHVAVRHGHLEHARLLINAGACLHAMDSKERMPLNLADELQNEKMIALLVAAKASRAKKNVSATQPERTLPKELLHPLHNEDSKDLLPPKAMWVMVPHGLSPEMLKLLELDNTHISEKPLSKKPHDGCLLH